MRGRKGFTLVELLVVIIIVGILAAVSIPLMTGNLARARATEAVAALGAIRTQMRLIRAEEASYIGQGVVAGLQDVVGNVPGFPAGSLDGTYYLDADYTITVAANAITIDAAARGNAPAVQMNTAGTINYP